jgi:acyl carrier protein
VTRIGLLELDWAVLSRFLPASRAPKFSELARHDEKSLGAGEPAQDVRRWVLELKPAELLPAVVDLVRTELAQILRIAPERIEAGASLFELGMDSLMAVELASSIEARVGVQLSALSLSDSPTVERIAGRIAQQLRPEEAPAANPAMPVDLVDQVRLVAARHASELTEEEATDFGSEMRETAAPKSLVTGLTTGQHS